MERDESVVEIERDSMEFDVVIVGAGPAGLATAIRLKQLAAEKNQEINVCVLEKGAEVGAHILAGAVIDPESLTELLPDWKKDGAPLQTEVTHDEVLFLTATGTLRTPEWAIPPGMKNHGAYIGSAAQLVRWLGEQAEALAATLLLPAAIEIRSNLLKGKATALQKKLAEAGVAAETVPEAPAALRVMGRPALTRLPLFENGWFELQDAGSQAIAECGAARRGERVIDFCAGAGGKTLALAARMRNQGQVLAFDTDEARLSRLGPRLKRAGVDIVTQMRLKDSHDARLARYQGWADLVLVDAPCSGSGTLRRHPDLKWRLQPQEVAHYRQLQRQIMAAAARLLRPGGRLVYATCSLLADENEAQMAWLAHRAGGVSAAGGAAGAADAAGAAERAANLTGAASAAAVGAAAGGVQATDPTWPAVSLQPVAQRYWLPQPEGGDVFFMASWTRA